jgi:hypothetical protein
MIILLTKNQRTIIDNNVLQWILGKCWYATFSHGHWYAASRRRDKILLLHRIIVGAKLGETVDHINMDTLDNRKRNLRCCSFGENNCNRPGFRKSTSKFKGVSWHRRGQKWQVHIEKDGKSHYLGLFVSEKDAAIAYNKAAIRIHRQFAYLNEIGGQNV